jgi:anti-sigma factor RsiW
MHGVVTESLEEYLAGTLDPVALRNIEAHLNACGMCRDQMRSMQDVSQLFVSLRAEESCEPSPGFYAEVMERVSERRAAPSFANFFGLNLAFERRLVFASLLTLAVLGSFLVAREWDQGSPSPEAVLAQQNSPAFDAQSGEDNMLVTLTAYEH